MIDVLVPEEQEGTKAVVRAWLKQIGDRVEVNDPLVELETDKVAMEVPAPAAGVLREILLHTRRRCGARRGARADRAEADADESLARAKAEPVERPSRRAPRPTRLRRRSARTRRETRLSPSVKRAVLQHDLDPDRIEGTGRGGRITRADVDRAVEAATRGRGRAARRGRRHPLALRAARPDAARHRREHAALGHPGAARHRGVRGRFQRDHRPSRGAQGGLREEGRQAHLHRLSGRRGGRGDEGRAGDQQPLARRPARALRRHQYRRRHRARRQGPDRAGAAQGAAALAQGHRRRPRRADRESARRRS